MRYALIIIIALSLAACSGYPYKVKDAGDGVYYAESPPEYTWVDGYWWPRYGGPYLYPYYGSHWISPVWSHHGYGYRPPYSTFPPYLDTAYWNFASNAAVRNNRVPVRKNNRKKVPGLPLDPVDPRVSRLDPGLTERYERRKEPGHYVYREHKYSKPAFKSSSRSGKPSYSRSRSAPAKRSRDLPPSLPRNIETDIN
jgi:hypothetical protein